MSSALPFISFVPAPGSPGETKCIRHGPVAAGKVIRNADVDCWAGELKR
jgi:hypothetical protein